MLKVKSVSAVAMGGFPGHTNEEFWVETECGQSMIRNTWDVLGALYDQEKSTGSDDEPGLDDFLNENLFDHMVARYVARIKEAGVINEELWQTYDQYTGGGEYHQ